MVRDNLVTTNGENKKCKNGMEAKNDRWVVALLELERYLYKISVFERANSDNAFWVYHLTLVQQHYHHRQCRL